MKGNLSLVALATALVVATGCVHRSVTPVSAKESSQPTQSGQNKKMYDFKGFSAITVSTSANLTVEVGPAESVKIEGDDDRISEVTATVKDGTLEIKEKSKFRLFGSGGKLNIIVTVPELKGLVINGSADGRVDGIKGDAFAATINGSGDLELYGETGSLTIQVNGAGDINAKSLKAKSATVGITGSGNVETSATETLSSSITGSGDVTYYGDPKVTKSTTGSGTVTKG